MNRWVVPLATVVALGAAVGGAVLWPGMPTPAVPQPPDTSRVTLVCPSFEGATTSVRVAATSTGTDLRTALLSDPTVQDQPNGVTVLADRPEPVLLSGPRATTFGGVSLAGASAGPDRGLSATPCRVPATLHWFTGVGLDEASQTDLVLANTDSTDAAVDVTLYGPDGRINTPGSRGIVVEANATRNVPLSVLASATGPVTIQVESSDGRVATSLRQRLWDGGTPLGADWIPAGPEPSGDLVVAGIPAGDGTRELVIGNPGDRTASIDLEVLSPDGLTQLTGLESLELPAGTTRSYDLEPGLAGLPVSLHLTSSQPVVAAAMVSTAGKATQRDPAWVAAVAPIGNDGVWPVPASKDATSVLQLANPGTTEATVTVTLGNQLGGPGQEGVVNVPAGSSVQVPVTAAETSVVRVQASGSPVRGAIVVTQTLGKVRGLAVVPLVVSGQQGDAPQVEFDPHAGS